MIKKVIFLVFFSYIIIDNRLNVFLTLKKVIINKIKMNFIFLINFLT